VNGWKSKSFFGSSSTPAPQAASDFKRIVVTGTGETSGFGPCLEESAFLSDRVTKRHFGRRSRSRGTGYSLPAESRHETSSVKRNSTRRRLCTIQGLGLTPLGGMQLAPVPVAVWEASVRVVFDENKRLSIADFHVRFEFLRRGRLQPELIRSDSEPKCQRQRYCVSCDRWPAKAKRAAESSRGLNSQVS